MELTPNRYELLLEKCAYKDSKRLTREEQEVWINERAICQLDLFHFLKWVKIMRPPTPGSTGATIFPFKLLPHTTQFFKALLTEPLVTVLKARQVFVSTSLAQYVLWYALGKVGANILLFSKGQPEAKELLNKAHRIYDLLPGFLKLRIEPDSTEELGFPSISSHIRAFPSTVSAGISYTASIVVADEHAEHPYADENYISSKPTRDAGGQFISVFTQNPYSNDNLATSIFLDAIEKKNDFLPMFFPWDVVPDRDETWYNTVKRNIPDRELGRLSPQLYMAKNYPKTIDEALSMAESIVCFDKETLNIMTDDVRSQINTDSQVWKDAEIDSKICHIYKDYHIGNWYIASSDVGQGSKADESILIILDVKTGDVVADIKTNELPPAEFALHSVNLLKHFHSPIWWIEHNIPGGGREVIKKAVELGYHNLGYRGDKPMRWSIIEDPDTLKRVGFFTDETNRADLFGALIPAINDHQIRIYNKDGLNQFYSMVRNSLKNGKIEATAGHHDDYVLALGIAWLKRNTVKPYNAQVKAIKTLDFGPTTGNSLMDQIIARQGVKIGK
uniref:Putative terminase n=1 Tax=viral metagenome TaxID=1070528 RepID=A0A6M3KE21_9ZZZZ